MTREVLFRGKRIDNGEWRESVCPLGEMHSGTVLADFVLDTVGQYTGLTDKNGKRIFEGDICQVCRGVDVETGYVYYDERISAYGVRYNEKQCNLLLDIYMSKDPNVWIEIIGNIYDNK